MSQVMASKRENSVTSWKGKKLAGCVYRTMRSIVIGQQYMEKKGRK
jgi:hypothetical protein